MLICTFNKYHMLYTYYIYDIISSYYFFLNMIELHGYDYSPFVMLNIKSAPLQKKEAF